jgi:hypothetical protein
VVGAGIATSLTRGLGVAALVWMTLGCACRGRLAAVEPRALA